MSLFIFRKDLRIYDNTTLNKLKGDIYPIFIFDRAQLTSEYASARLIAFMMECLADLQKQLRLVGGELSYAIVERQEDIGELIADIASRNPIKAICYNSDYTPYGRARDKALDSIAKGLKLEIVSYSDYTLKPIDKPYRKYTPFKRYYLTDIPKPVTTNHTSYRIIKISSKFQIDLSKLLADLTNSNGKVINKDLIGGRLPAIAILKNIQSGRSSYLPDTRNQPSVPSTRLSAYLRFGCVSARETYSMVEAVAPSLVGELVWRDFYAQLLYYNPGNLYTIGNDSPPIRNYWKLPWVSLGTATGRARYAAWCAGTTGYPIVDAGMRQLAATGFMHNRVRMIVADFLIKILHLNWAVTGEKYFAQNLTDYEIAANNGNWWWVAGAAWGQQKTRVFNPWRQSLRFDAEAAYIKAWVPELRDVSVVDIHAWADRHKTIKADYPAPIVDYVQQKKKYLEFIKG